MERRPVTEESSPVVQNLVAWASRRRVERVRREQDAVEVNGERDPDRCPPPQDLCADPRRPEEPEQRLSFRSSVLLDEPPIADVVALTPLHCIVLGGPELKEWLLSRPTVAFRMLQTELRRLRTANTWRS